MSIHSSRTSTEARPSFGGARRARVVTLALRMAMPRMRFLSRAGVLVLVTGLTACGLFSPSPSPRGASVAQPTRSSASVDAGAVGQAEPALVEGVAFAPLKKEE